MQGNSQARRAVPPPDCRKPDEKYFVLLLPDPKHWWFLQLQIPQTLQVGALFAHTRLTHGLVHTHPGESGQAEPVRAQCQGRTSSSSILLPQNSSGSTGAAQGGWVRVWRGCCWSLKLTQLSSSPGFVQGG